MKRYRTTSIRLTWPCSRNDCLASICIFHVNVLMPVVSLDWRTSDDVVHEENLGILPIGIGISIGIVVGIFNYYD